MKGTEVMDAPAESPLTEENPTVVPPRPRSWSKAFLALAASLFVTGFGQVLAGRARRGIAWFLVSGIMMVLVVLAMAHPRTLMALLVFAPLSLIVTLASYADAVRCGFRSARPMLQGPVVRVALGAGLLVVAALINFPARAAYLLRGHVVETFVASSGSMKPTLAPGDRFQVNKRVAWGRWDMVVFETPTDPGVPFVKRVVGLPGETVEIRGDHLMIDGTQVSPPAGVGPYCSMNYLGNVDPGLRGRPGAGCEGNPIQLGNDECFLLGDNTRLALDGRLWEIPAGDHQLGAVPIESIKGPVVAIYWPPSRWRMFK